MEVIKAITFLPGKYVELEVELVVFHSFSQPHFTTKFAPQFDSVISKHCLGVIQLRGTDRTDQLTDFNNRPDLLAHTILLFLSVFFRLPPSLHYTHNVVTVARWQRWQHYYFFPPYSAVAYRHCESFFSMGHEELLNTPLQLYQVSFNIIKYRSSGNHSAKRQKCTDIY